MSSIEITIPVLNEEGTIGRQVRFAREYFDANLTDLGQIELVIADNGSDDGTQAICEHLVEDLAGVRYLRLGDRGVGLALKASWSQSEADIVGYMDLDLATDLAHLREALSPLVKGEVDIVTGSRLLPQSKVVNRSPVRALVSRVFNAILSAYLGVRFSDGMCGFKFLQRRHLAGLRDLGAKSDGWFFATELLVCAEASGLRLLDLPVTWTDDPNSKAKIGKLAVEYMRAMRALRKDIKRQMAEPSQSYPEG